MGAASTESIPLNQPMVFNYAVLFPQVLLSSLQRQN